jgi:hypothetical protein
MHQHGPPESFYEHIKRRQHEEIQRAAELRLIAAARASRRDRVTGRGRFTRAARRLASAFARS